VRGIRARNGIISEAECEAAVLYAIVGGGVSNSRRQGTDQVNVQFSGLNKIHSQLTAYTGQSVHAVS